MDTALMEEIRRYFQILATLHTTRADRGESGVCFALLTRTLQERLDDHLDRIFRLLGLRYPARDIYNAFAATNSRDRSIRANAVEFLDNILAKELKKVLIPIVEELPPEEVLQQANGVLDLPFTNRKEALQSLLERNDPWLRACTLYEIGRCGLVDDFRHVMHTAAQDQNAVVRETAEFVLKKFAPPTREAKDR
ncbi:MAG: hypothetical protein D6743_05190 [Calditrichaeota bacterium]|nr:MAG: hypothetical protein D6743_05190 [Calditrichota bacterium]